MDIVVNGEPRRVEEGLSVSGLLAELGVSVDYLVVERNRVIVPREAFDATTLKADDHLEVIRFIGGGRGRGLPIDS